MDATPHALIEICNVPCGGVWLDLQVRCGESVLLTVPSAQVGSSLLAVLLGLEPPEQGQVWLFGERPEMLGPRELSQLRSRIGVVPEHGGLISNLRVWENLLLPLEYHRRLDRQTVELQGRQALAQVGYQGELLARPSDLDLFARKQVMLARALLLEPPLLVCAALTLGLAPREQEQLLAVTRSYCNASPLRAILHVTADAQLAAALPQARTVTLNSRESL